MVSVAGRRVYAHRLSYVLFIGPIPAGIDCCHTCDNPPCVNPDHLYLGRPLDNIGDAAAKGRIPRGEGHYNAKLTEADVQAIRQARNGLRRARDDHHSLEALAHQYGVCTHTIWRIINRETWKWLP
jgi:hypothetical protein